jgi:hypothetical protein
MVRVKARKGVKGDWKHPLDEAMLMPPLAEPATGGSPQTAISPAHHHQHLVKLVI